MKRRISIWKAEIGLAWQMYKTAKKQVREMEHEILYGKPGVKAPKGILHNEIQEQDAGKDLR